MSKLTSGFESRNRTGITPGFGPCRGLNVSDSQPASPVAKLSDDVLCMIFLEACHENHRLGQWWGANVTISHVCRRWRHQALALGRLWDVFRWTFAINAEQADIVLKRSQATPLKVVLDLFCTVDVSPEVVAITHDVVRRVMDHLYHIADLEVMVTPKLWDAQAFAPLFNTIRPAAMPRLKRLFFATMGALDGHLSIECHDLHELKTPGVMIRGIGPMVGPSTISVTLGGRSLACSELVDLLVNATNLKDLTIGDPNFVTTIYDDSISDASHGSSLEPVQHVHLRCVNIWQRSQSELPLLRRTLPMRTITHVTVLQHIIEDTVQHDAFDFLSIPDLGIVTQLSLGAFGYCQNACFYSEKNVTRTMSYGVIFPFQGLAILFDVHPIIASIRTLDLSLAQWKGVMDIVDTRGACFPELQTLIIKVTDFMRPNNLDETGSDEELDDEEMYEPYTGNTIEFPALTSLQLEFYRNPPITRLVMRRVIDAALVALLSDVPIPSISIKMKAKVMVDPPVTAMMCRRLKAILETPSEDEFVLHVAKGLYDRLYGEVLRHSNNFDSNNL